MLYNLLYKTILSHLDPEFCHKISIKYASLHKNKTFKIKDNCLEIDFLGKKINNPIGLAAGIDKNCEAVPYFSGIGFGFVEIGTITILERYGNEKPRIKRLGKDIIWNHMGIPNDGIQEIVTRIISLDRKKIQSLIGVNVLPSEFKVIYHILHNKVDYFTVNISCPNIKNKTNIWYDLEKMYDITNYKVPILIKIPPIIDEVKKIINFSKKNKINGIICSNTLPFNGGGISGEPLKEINLKLIEYLYNYYEDSIPIIGLGGIYNYKDVLEYIKHGATAVQLCSSMFSNGPNLPKKIIKKLIDDSKKNDWENISNLLSIKI